MVNYIFMLIDMEKNDYDHMFCKCSPALLKTLIAKKKYILNA